MLESRLVETGMDKIKIVTSHQKLTVENSYLKREVKYTFYSSSIKHHVIFANEKRGLFYLTNPLSLKFFFLFNALAIATSIVELDFT